MDILYHGYDGGGADIDGPSVLVRKNFANKVSVSANYYADMVSSASVDVLATASPYTEERDEYSLGIEYLRNKTTMSLGYTNSSESDYEANTVGFSISQDFFGDLSTLTLSYAVGDDEVRENGNETFSASVDRQQFGVSLSQILSKNLIVNLQVETVVDEGFLNNPYRQVRYVDPTQTAPNQPGYSYEKERYPNTRNSDAVALRALYFLPWNASVKAEYRNYSDSWGIAADNYEIGYTHTFWDENLIAEFKYRNYSQTAADFYSDLFPFQNAQNFLARDKELSTYTNNGFGIGLSYKLPWKLHESIDQMSVNLYWDHMQFDYDDFRNATVAAPTPGQEPLYSFDANVIRLFFSIWY